MKKIITICFLVVTLLAGGMTMDAKTTKKKSSKARTSQTSSSNWNGSMPSGAYLFQLITSGNWQSTLRSKGFRDCNSEYGNGLTKDGVFMIDHWGGSRGAEWIITVYDTSKLDWLYNGLRQAASKNSYYDVSKSGNVITVSWG